MAINSMLVLPDSMSPQCVDEMSQIAFPGAFVAYFGIVLSHCSLQTDLKVSGVHLPWDTLSVIVESTGA